MAIATLDQYVNSYKQKITYMRNGTVRTTVANMYFSLFELTGNPSGGVLQGTVTGTATPILPTDATPGCPNILFAGSTGYLSKVTYSNTVACKFHLYDLLSKSYYVFNAGANTITNPLSISGRCPDYTGAADYGYGNEIWFEVYGTMTSAATWTVAVTYYNQAGALKTAITTTSAAAAALTIGKCLSIGLAAGDTGVQSIKSVTVTTGSAAAGGINILILRPLLTSMRVAVPGIVYEHDLLKTGMPRVYNDSALYVLTQTDSTSSGTPELAIEIAAA